MNHAKPIFISVHYPKNQESIQQLFNHLSDILAEFVLSKLSAMNCPSEQKFELLQTIIRQSDISKPL